MEDLLKHGGSMFSFEERKYVQYCRGRPVELMEEPTLWEHAQKRLKTIQETVLVTSFGHGQIKGRLCINLNWQNLSPPQPEIRLLE